MKIVHITEYLGKGKSTKKKVEVNHNQSLRKLLLIF